MKKFFSVIVVLLLLVPAMAQAVQSLEDTRIARPAPTSEETSGCQMSASGLVSLFGNKIAALKAVIVKKDTETANAIAKKDTETARSINALGEKIDKQGKDLKNFDDKLTGKGGEFAKTNTKIDAVDSSILWMAIGIILFIVGLGYFLARKIKGIVPELKAAAKSGAVDAVKPVFDKLEELPKKTVDAFKAREFDPAPFEFDVAGKHVIYTFPTDDKCYRTLKVEDTNGSTKPADFEQQALDNWYLAKKYVTGTMKRFLEGKLAGTSEELLIRHFQATGVIKIS